MTTAIASSSSITSWAEEVCQDPDFQNPECGRLITCLYALMSGEASPDETARKVGATLQPLIEKDSQSPEPSIIWEIFCTAVRALGSQKTISTRLVAFLQSIRQLSPAGKALRDSSGKTYWTDLPGFETCFREYGISTEDIEGRDLEEWSSETSPLHNATCFAAVALSQGLEIMAPYATESLTVGLDVNSRNKKIDVKSWGNIYLPPAFQWIHVAGEKIWTLCKEERVPGFSVGKWMVWREWFGQIGKDERFEAGMRAGAKRAAEYMAAINGNWWTNGPK